MPRRPRHALARGSVAGYAIRSPFACAAAGIRGGRPPDAGARRRRTTVMFTVINGVLLAPLPYPQPDRLIRIEEQTKGSVNFRFGDRWAFAYLNFLDCRSEIRSV